MCVCVCGVDELRVCACEGGECVVAEATHQMADRSHSIYLPRSHSI